MVRAGRGARGRLAPATGSAGEPPAAGFSGATQRRHNWGGIRAVRSGAQLPFRPHPKDRPLHVAHPQAPAPALRRARARGPGPHRRRRRARRLADRLRARRVRRRDPALHARRHPDTQYLYDDDRGDSEPLNVALDWIVAHRGIDTDNIAFTAGLGDVTQDGTADEVARASATYTILDRAKLPYSAPAGNHDIKSNTTDQRGASPFLSAFGPQRYQDDPTFGGASPDGYNAFHVFKAGGREWLVLALDWRLSDKGFAWAQSVLDAHPHMPAILTTHELVGSDGTRTAPSGYGQTVWDRLIRHNDQVFLALNGHFWPVGGTTMKNDFGHDVTLNLANYQDKYYGR
ncbi:MAG TPA: hypothetical protein VNT55_07140 [Baekduia sp.]|nr:hypothetical protein [Baekduia sp.]